MRSCCTTQVDPLSNSKSPVRDRKVEDTDMQRRRENDHEVRDRSDAAIRNANSHLKVEEARNDSPLELPKGLQSFCHFRLPASTTVRE